MRPPSLLTSARVTHYAIRDRTVGYVPRGQIWIGCKLLGAVPRLAIGVDVEGRYLLLYCGRTWKVRTAFFYTSVAEAKREAEHRYPGLSKRWRRTGVTKAQGMAYVKRMWKAGACSFCGRLPYQIQRMIEKGDARICNLCIDAFATRFKST